LPVQFPVFEEKNGGRLRRLDVKAAKQELGFVRLQGPKTEDGVGIPVDDRVDEPIAQVAHPIEQDQ
jgi:hypothetical protein